MNIREAQNYIDSLGKFGIKPGLERVRLLCERLGNPQNDLKFIHVAGTNGKGSVCSYISNILLAEGIKVGRFTSPAVIEYRERYWINGRNISQAAFCRNLQAVQEVVRGIIEEGNDAPTQFEVETALAFFAFKEAGCEIVVLECGMGGENDSTNIIGAPLVSVITSVSLDHMAVLGRNVEAIAKQKAGIIKKGGHVVCAPQVPEVLSVLKAKAALEKNDIVIVGDGDIKNVRWGLKSSSFDFGKYKGLKISLVGAYQTENAGVAIAAIESLRKEKIKISENAIRTGLLNATWPGRFEIIANKPMVIIDGAHNENAALQLAQSVEYYLHNEEENGKIIYIFGVLADKNYEAIAKIMSPHAAHVITVTPPNNQRALPAQELASCVSKYHSMVSVADSLTEALEMAYLLADKESVILTFGSLSFLGEIRQLVESRGTILKKKETKI